MKQAVYILFFTAFLFSVKANAQISIDGKFSDWEGTNLQYDDQNKLHYAFRKDKDFLYMRIKKDHNGMKVMSTGGIQLFFDKKVPDPTSAIITYAHGANRDKFLNLSSNVLDFLEIDNLGEIKNQALAKYNEFGILVECTYSHDEPKSEIIAYNANNDFKSVFDSEMQIPLELLEKKYGNNLYFKIRLRGADIALKGEQDIIRRNLFSPQLLNQSVEIRKAYEILFYTEFTGKLDLNAIN